MRILYLTPTGFFSGGERVTLEIAKEMQFRGHTVAYAGLEGPVRQSADAYGVPFLSVPVFTPAEVKKLSLSFSPDIIHCMDYRASLYAAMTGFPFVSHLHSNVPWLPGLGPNVWAMLYFGKKAARILTVSESVMREYRFGRTLEPKTVTLENTVDTESVRLRALEALPPEAETLPKAFDLLFFGRMTEQKNPFRFLDLTAAVRAKLPTVTACMIGSGELLPDAKAYAARLDLTDSVTFAGFLDNPFPLVKRAKILLMPSVVEGFGLTCVESMALGLPALVSPVGGLKTLVTKDCGAVCETDEQFVEEAVRLLTNDAVYRTAFCSAVSRAEKYAQGASYFDTVEQVYFDAVSNTKGEAAV